MSEEYATYLRQPGKRTWITVKRNYFCYFNFFCVTQRHFRLEAGKITNAVPTLVSK